MLQAQLITVGVSLSYLSRKGRKKKVQTQLQLSSSAAQQFINGALRCSHHKQREREPTSQ
jgi:hypothetical protein